MSLNHLINPDKEKTGLGSQFRIYTKDLNIKTDQGTIIKYKTENQGIPGFGLKVVEDNQLQFREINQVVFNTSFLMTMTSENPTLYYAVPKNQIAYEIITSENDNIVSLSGSFDLYPAQLNVNAFFGYVYVTNYVFPQLVEKGKQHIGLMVGHSDNGTSVGGIVDIDPNDRSRLRIQFQTYFISAVPHKCNFTVFYHK